MDLSLNKEEHAHYTQHAHGTQLALITLPTVQPQTLSKLIENSVSCICLENFSFKTYRK